VALLALAPCVWALDDSDAQPPEPPTRVYRDTAAGAADLFDLVCEAALAATYEIGATEVQTTLDPVTGTPFICIDERPSERSDWIEARFNGAELVIDVSAAPGDPGSADGVAEPSAAAVWVWPRAMGAGEAHAQDLAGRYLEALDRAVTARLRRSLPGPGPTPTPWSGPPLEPTPLGPPELAPPRPPTPGP
jgi:hypothetical protein